MASADTIDRDGLLAGRFDTRVRAAATSLIPLHVAAILVNAVVDGRPVPALAHLTMAAMAWFMVRRSSDMIRMIIFSHVYWTFSFMTYLYAATHLQTASYGLGDPERSALIALASQTGLFLAFFLSPSGPIVAPDQLAEFQERRALVRRAQWLLIGLGLVGVLGTFTGGYPKRTLRP